MTAAAILTHDLIFPSMIEGAARGAGVKLHTCATIGRLVEVVTEHSVAYLLLDLACLEPKSDLSSVLQEVRATGFAGEVIAFGPHVQANRLDEARVAGCDRVMTRGQFHSQLGQLFR